MSIDLELDDVVDANQVLVFHPKQDAGLTGNAAVNPLRLHGTMVGRLDAFNCEPLSVSVSPRQPHCGARARAQLTADPIPRHVGRLVSRIESFHG
jgi:hypothetical protein